MKKITIEIVDHHDQRYPTCGDWFTEKDAAGQVLGITIRVSRLPHWKLEFLVALHELVEMALCDSAGVGEREVDQFDLAYTGEGEPGNDMSAPYWAYHQEAEGIERMVAALLRVNWQEYERAIAAL